MTSLLKLILGVQTALAQTGVGQNAANAAQGVANPSGTINASSLPGNPISLDQLFTNLMKDIFIGLGLVAFIGLVWAGIMYITAGGDAAKAEKARKSIIWTL